MAWQQYDAKLDKLYGRTIRCPYCKNRIHAMESACSVCGLSKKQISEASNSRAKNIIATKAGGAIVMTRRRPDDVSFTKMAGWLLLGAFGAHNFYVGRRVRGWIMLSAMLSLVLSVLIFSMGDSNNSFAGMHEWRKACKDLGIGIFPFDLPGILAVLVWFYDCFAVVFGTFKYPVRLGDGKAKI